MNRKRMNFNSEKFGSFIVDGINLEKGHDDTLEEVPQKVANTLNESLKTIHNVHDTRLLYKDQIVLKDVTRQHFVLLPPKVFKKKELKNLLITYTGTGFIIFNTGLEKGVFVDEKNMYYNIYIAELREMFKEI